MLYLLGFCGMTGLFGLGYLSYYQYTKINTQIQSLISNNQLNSHLFDLNQQSAYSIDTVMDAFESGYNRGSINNYRSTLADMCRGRVLQTCAGSNRNLKYYKAGTKLTLIDYSPNMVSFGSTKTSPMVKYDYVVGDVMSMPFQDDSYDYVIDTFGLEYVTNPHKALTQMRRVCRKDGTILLLNEGLSNILQFHYYQNMKWGYNLLRGGYFSNRNWQKLIKQFDFQIEHTERKKNGKLYLYVLRNKKQGKIQPKETVVL